MNAECLHKDRESSRRSQRCFLKHEIHHMFHLRKSFHKFPF